MAKKTTAAPANASSPEAETPADDIQGETVTHKYPDGSAVVGSAPFPEKSPLQRARELSNEGKAQA